MSSTRRAASWSLVFSLLVGCSAETSAPPGGGGDGGTTVDAGGLAPGSPCAFDVDAGEPRATSCRDNPALLTCFMCVDLTEDGVRNGTCAYACRVGKDDCPAGQTCSLTPNTYTTSFQPCRTATGDVELGYCH